MTEITYFAFRIVLCRVAVIFFAREQVLSVCVCLHTHLSGMKYFNDFAAELKDVSHANLGKPILAFFIRMMEGAPVFHYWFHFFFFGVLRTNEPLLKCHAQLLVLILLLLDVL